MSTVRDIQLAQRARKAGAQHSLRIIIEARKVGLPISLAFALVEQESNFLNIFGHDKGSPAHLKGKPVTKARVAELLRFIRNGGVSNGVGVTQLTFPGFIIQADRLGGAHIVKNQIKVGFAILAGHVAKFGQAGGLSSYNAGDPYSSYGRRYAREVGEKQDRWHKILTAGDKR